MSEHVLARALSELQTLRDRLVVVGGSAHRLFPVHEFGTAPPWELLTTEDVDLAADRDLQLTHGKNPIVIDALRAAGFREEIAGADTAAHRYVLDDAAGYLEFIAPRQGSGQRRDGTSVTALHFGGVVAEPLPEVDLLLHEPWTTTVEGGVEVSVVNPIAYLVQKLLVLPDRRSRTKRAKDLLYLHDTLAIFAPKLGELRQALPRLRPPLTTKREKRLTQALARYASKVTDDHREAAAIADAQRERPPTAAQLVRVLSGGLVGLLGPG